MEHARGPDRCNGARKICEGSQLVAGPGLLQLRISRVRKSMLTLKIPDGRSCVCLRHHCLSAAATTRPSSLSNLSWRGSLLPRSRRQQQQQQQQQRFAQLSFVRCFSLMASAEMQQPLQMRRRFLEASVQSWGADIRWRRGCDRSLGAERPQAEAAIESSG